MRPRRHDYEAEWAGEARWCPVCERPAGKFGVFGSRRRQNARCPWCQSLERHRFAWLLLTGRSDLLDGRPKRVLHFAPERALEPRFRERLGEGYVTADLLDPKADMQLDITAMPLPDEGFDMIYCSHVLEHVVEDRKAMREMWRVLKPGGWALVSVPMMAERTIEDPSVTDPEERTRVFGQADHVRIYGRDFIDRLREAGFEVEIYLAREMYSEQERERMGLGKASGEAFICRKDK